MKQLKIHTYKKHNGLLFRLYSKTTELPLILTHRSAKCLKNILVPIYILFSKEHNSSTDISTHVVVCAIVSIFLKI